MLGILHQAAVERLGAHRIHPGYHLIRFGQDPSGLTWGEYIDRATGASVGRIEADLLVGCDGIHSAVRHERYPEEGPPRWNGVTMWRGVTLGAPYLSGRAMINAGSSKQRVVIYPIAQAEEERGRALFNWVATMRTAESGPMPPQDWTYTADRDAVLRAFASFTFAFLDVPALMRGAETIYQYPMVDRDPLPSWHFVRVMLLGDAAHPMQPVGGNGASQAILDARILARELAMQPTIEAAIATYEGARRPAMAELVRSNGRARPHRCQDLVEERTPEGFTNLHAVVSLQELEAIADEYKRTAGYEIERLNERASFSVR